MISKFLMSFIFLLSFSPLCQVHATSTENRIAAVVNDKIITKADLNDRISMAILSAGLPAIPEVRAQLRPQVLDMMINEELQRQHAESFRIECQEEDIDRYFQDIEHRNNMPTGHLKTLLAQHHIPLAIMREHIKAGILWRQYIRSRYEPLVQVGEEDITRAQKELENAKSEARVYLLEIFLDVPSEDQEQVIHKRAQELTEKLRQGANFSAVAEQFSQAASAAKGGHLGWILSSQLDPHLPKIINKLSVGEISDPIRLQNGYAIFLVQHRKNPGESTEKEILVSFIQTLIPLPPAASQQTLQQALFKASSLIHKAKSCGMMMKLVEKDSTIKVQHTQKIPVENLPLDLQKLLNPLSINESSKPVLSQEGVFIFKKCTQEVYNPEEISREQIQEQIIQTKLSLLAQQEMMALRRASHIDVRS